MKKKYYNSTTKEWYTEGNSLTRRVNGALFSGVPSVEQLEAWGFVEWVEPAPTPEELLERAKASKIGELEAYDASDAVNSFIIKNNNQTITYWFTPEQRADYKNSIDAAELLDIEELHPIVQGIEFTITTAFAKIALARLQLYANKCYSVTENHKHNINNLTTVEQVNNYDITLNYPPKLDFEL